MIWRDILEINLGYIIEMILLISLIFLFVSLIACHVYKKMNEKYNSDDMEGFEPAPLEYSSLKTESAQQLEADVQQLKASAYTSPGDKAIHDAQAGQLEKVAQHTKEQANSAQKAQDAEAQTMHDMQGKLKELIELSNQAKEINESFTNKF